VQPPNLQRPDLVAGEQGELTIIERYLPQPASEESVRAWVAEAISAGRHQSPLFLAEIERGQSRSPLLSFPRRQRYPATKEGGLHARQYYHRARSSAASELAFCM